MPPPYSQIVRPLAPVEIEEALADLAASFPAVCTLETFPHTSADGDQRIHFIKIANGTGPNRPRLLFVGGVHAREWVPPDALVRFAQNLLTSYDRRAALTYGPMSCTPVVGYDTDEPEKAIPDGIPVHYPRFTVPASTVARIVDNVDLYIAPLINPDGRQYDLLNPRVTSNYAGWRKNRRRHFIITTRGVDINRNHDIAWDFNAYYNMALYKRGYPAGQPASISLGNDDYRGPSAASEPETKNIQWIVDAKRVNYFIDIHTYGRWVLVPWSIEFNGTEPTMTHRARNWDGRRDGLDPRSSLLNGLTDYQEFIPNEPPYFVADRLWVVGHAMRDSILRSAGVDLRGAPDGDPKRAHSTYTVQQSAGVYLPKSGPFTGGSDDYTFHLQFADPSRAPILAFTLEMGAESEEKGFRPDYPSMGPRGHYAKIERETHAALVEFCTIAAHGQNSYFRPGVPVASQRQTEDQVDVFAVDFTGALNVSWFIEGDRWHGPERISASRHFPRRAHVTACRQTEEKLDVYAVDANGALNVAWVVKTEGWNGPRPMMNLTGYFPPGAPVACEHQTEDQVDVFAVDVAGALNVSWFIEGDGWHGPERISPTGYFPPGARVACVRQTEEKLDVYAVDANGALNVSWVVKTGAWNGPRPVSPAGYFPPGAPVACGHQTEEKVDVYAVDDSGALNVTWFIEGDGWHGPEQISETGRFPRGAAVAFGRQTDEQVDVFAVDVGGALNVTWFIEGDGWHGPERISGFDYFPPGSPMAFIAQTDEKIDVYAVDATGALNVSWAVETEPWNAPGRFTVGRSSPEPDSTTTLESSPNPSLLGRPVTLTATVTGSDTTAPPTGSVTFVRRDRKPQRVGLTDGVASLSVPDLPVGESQILAEYSGDEVFGRSRRAALHRVKRSTTRTAVAGRLMIRGETPF